MAEPVAFVTGWPIAHSRSPSIHRHWLETYGLKGRYERVPVEPDAFESFIQTLGANGYCGGNVTLPHKETAYREVAELTPEAERIGAVNTVWLEQGKLFGTNTDAYGFLANLDDRLPGWDKGEIREKGALVVGAGGAARAIVYGLQSRGFSSIRIANRTVERAAVLADHFGEPCCAVPLEALGDDDYGAGLVVNTSSVGMKGDRLSLDLHRFAESTIVTDIVYTPLETPLLADAAARGLRTVDGLGMLLHQAVPGFELWFSKRPRVSQALRALILDELEEAR